MKKYCPTQGGKFTGYLPEYKVMTVKGKWKRVNFTRDPDGVPSPLAFGGVLKTINLLGYWQAATIGCAYAAYWESLRNERIKIRIVHYEVVYDIKARRIVKGD